MCVCVCVCVWVFSMCVPVSVYVYVHLYACLCTCVCVCARVHYFFLPVNKIIILQRCLGRDNTSCVRRRLYTFAISWTLFVIFTRPSPRQDDNYTLPSVPPPTPGPLGALTWVACHKFMDRKASSGRTVCHLCLGDFNGFCETGSDRARCAWREGTPEHIAAQSLFCGEHFFVPCFCYALDCRGLSVGTI